MKQYFTLNPTRARFPFLSLFAFSTAFSFPYPFAVLDLVSLF